MGLPVRVCHVISPLWRFLRRKQGKGAMQNRAADGIHAGPNQSERSAVLDRLVKDVALVVPGRVISVLTADPATGSFCCLVGGEHRTMSPGQGDRIVERLRAGEPWVHAESAAGRTGGKGGANLEAFFPLFVRGELEHVLLVAGEVVGDGDVRLISAYCRQTALVLETLAMQARLDQKIQRLSTLVRLVDDLSIEQNYRNLLQTVLDQSTELLLAEQGSIMLVEKETNQLLVEASKGAAHEQDRQVRVPRGVGISGQVAASGNPILVEDIEHDPRIGRKNKDRYKSRSFVSVPLKIGQQVVGVMNFNDKRTGEQFDDVDLSLAETCASHAAVVLDRKQIYEQTAKLTRQATIDDLTGLFNRASILGRLREEMARSERHGKLMSIVLLDIDGFKTINDRSGHAGGDLVLRRLAEVMTSAVRTIDIVGRYGGDEFLIILPETDTYFAAHMSERVLRDIETAHIFGEDNGGGNKVTVSMGIATFPSHGTSAEVLVEHADEALYRAKSGGKNRVVVY